MQHRHATYKKTTFYELSELQNYFSHELREYGTRAKSGAIEN
jgi:hypothetical protein